MSEGSWTRLQFISILRGHSYSDSLVRLALFHLCFNTFFSLPVLQGSMGSIACIAWKGDTLVLGDVDGNLNFWDLKARLSR